MPDRSEFPEFDRESDRDPAVDRLGWLRRGWFVPIVAAILIYEVTSNPALGVAVVCTKFGLRDFRTAFWLRRTDPVRSRGRACSWFYACFGIFKTGAMAFLAICVLMAAHAVFRDALPRSFRGQMLAAVLTIAACYGLGMLSSCMGVLIALMTRRKVWVDPRLHRAREVGSWPPSFDGPRGFANGAGTVVLGASVVFLLILLLLFVIPGAVLLSILEQRQGLPADNTILILFASFGVGVLAVTSFTFHRMSARLRNRVVALSPEECYPLG